MIETRLKLLRDEMKKRNISLYIIPTSDFHQSEMMTDYFKTRKFMSGFTGSDGTLIVTDSEARLWVDGRYFLQADIELRGTSIIKMEIGEPDVPSIWEYINETVSDGDIVGFDGRVFNADFVISLAEMLIDKNAGLYTGEDLVDIIWKERPRLSRDEIFYIPLKYTGESIEEKIKKLQKYLERKNADACIISNLDEVVWLLNMRGNDIKQSMLAFAYAVIERENKYVFIDCDRLTDELKREFEKAEIKVLSYDSIYEFVSKWKSKNIITDLLTLNYKIYQSIDIDTEIQDEVLPIQLWKSCKNDIEISNTRNIHIIDGVAVTKFIYWLKQEITHNKNITEYFAALKLGKFRRISKEFICESFDTIAAYKENGAIVHYIPNESKSKYLEDKGMLLLDSGGQYWGGTTDVTRTIVLGEISVDEKEKYTLVLKALIRLSMGKFIKGVTGQNIDILARGILWNMNLDYKHGTGHGISYMGNVHEGPQAFRWRYTPTQSPVKLLPGMITSNEPGYYEEGNFGIRLENATVIEEDLKNEYGEFLKLGTLTAVPFDKEAIEVNMLSEDEIKWINDYHKWVFDSVSNYLDENEKKWLKNVTSEIRK